MALFCSTCRFPIPSPQSQRKFAIQRILAERSSISAIQTPNSSKVSSFTGLVLFNLNPSLHSTQCCLSSSSGPSVETQSISQTAIIFVKGLARSTSEGSLKTAFSQFGDVNKVKIILDKKTRQSLGFAYIWFSSEEFAQSAVEEMNGKFLEGRFINVSIARPGACKIRAASGMMEWKHIAQPIEQSRNHHSSLPDIVEVCR